MSNLYEKDFYVWTQENVRLMRERKFSELDIENIAEEIEAMGKRDKRELISRLAVLLTHLLKWQYQADFRSKSWKSALVTHRVEIERLLKDSPGLKHGLNDRTELDFPKKSGIFQSVSQSELRPNSVRFGIFLLLFYAIAA